MQQVTATPGPLRDLQRKQKSQVASVATVPTEPARTKYLSNDNNEKSDFPISSATSLNSTLFISTTSTSNDPAAPLVIEKNNSSNNALCTPHFKMLCGGCADRKDRSKTEKVPGVLRGRPHKNFRYFNSNCTLPCRRCNKNHSGQGLFCTELISATQQSLFNTTIAHCQGGTEVDWELYVASETKRNECECECECECE
tara:strand:+ start:494 stop:1087 length:594 start_codon:yes stop_codon:yes gene_type:complete